MTAKPPDQDVTVLEWKGLSNHEVWIQKERGEIPCPFSLFLLPIESQTPNKEQTEHLSAQTAKALLGRQSHPLAGGVLLRVSRALNSGEEAWSQKPQRPHSGPAEWGHVITQKADSKGLL